MNSEYKFEQIIHKIDPQSRLRRMWRLEGGVSAYVTALEVARADGRIQKMLVRQHGERDLKSNLQIAADEFRLLQILQAEGLAAPAPYYLDQSGEIFSTPSIVIEYVEGQTEFAPADLAAFISQFATHLARIHQVDGSRLDLSFLPQQTQRFGAKLRERPAEVVEDADERRIRALLNAVWPLQQYNASVLLHGDFWPGNILWRDGQLVAVIDWEDAACGDPLADLANSRLEILWAFGSDAMQHFTSRYRSMIAIDCTNLPYWDLCAALRVASQFTSWASDEFAAKNMRARHQWFIDQACEKLSAQGLSVLMAGKHNE